MSMMTRSARRLPLLGALLPALALAGCISLGPKPPAELLRLTPAEQAPAGAGEAVAPGRAVTVMIPFAPSEIANTRVPVHAGNTQLTYVKDAVWGDMPNKLFRDLLAETIRVRTGRPVLDARDYHLAPGMKLSGRLQQFGVDAGAHQAMLVYDATLQRSDKQIETKRFTATAPIDAVTNAGVAPGLNTVANQVAQQVADWVGR
jgi:cholesterol transport system auxiliary component